MQDKNGNFITYYVDSFFQVPFEYRDNAEKYCKYLSQRDNKKYKVVQLLMMTYVDYIDKKFEKVFKEVEV